MSTPAVRRPATARDIILEVVRNMREGLEPLHYTTLPPAIYHVYLHSEDFERLRGIFPRMQEETRQALDAEMAELNRASLGERLKLARKPASKVVAPDGGWRIEFFENTDDDVEAGDIVIYSELALPAKTEFGAGSMTKRINTRRLAGELTASQRYEEQLPATKEMEAYATIEYEDQTGRQTDYGSGRIQNTLQIIGNQESSQTSRHHVTAKQAPSGKQFRAAAERSNHQNGAPDLHRGSGNGVRTKPFPTQGEQE